MSAYAQFPYGYPSAAVNSLASSMPQLSSAITPPSTMSTFVGSVTVSPGASTTSSSSSNSNTPCIIGASSGTTNRLNSPGAKSSDNFSPLGSTGGSSQPLPASAQTAAAGLSGPVAGGGGGSTAPSSPLSSLTAPPRTSCCDTGRIIADPLTGQPICSCRYSPSNAAALLSSHPRVGGGLSHPSTHITHPHAAASTGHEALYGSPYAVAAAAQAYAMPLGADTSAFYPPPPFNYDLKDRTDAWSAIAQPTACYPYDTMGYAYGQSALAQRKNATREATGTLKAWLQEHIKNPYPTKGEKIMLAIITKMTLTQVSTWFANARRRLKKENKMVWSPRNRSDEDGGKDSDDDLDDDVNDKDDSRHHDDDDEIHVIDNGLDDVSSLHPDDKLDRQPPACSKQQQPIGSMNTGTMPSMGGRDGHDSATSPVKPDSGTVKPRIWSLADVATSGQQNSSMKDTTDYTHTIQHRPLRHLRHDGLSSPGLGSMNSLNGFRPWINGGSVSMYPPSSTHAAMLHPSSAALMGGLQTAGTPPGDASLTMTQNVQASGISPSSGLGQTGTASTGLNAAAAGLLRPYPISARAEVH